jgi:hypothetical protein
VMIRMGAPEGLLEAVMVRDGPGALAQPAPKSRPTGICICTCIIAPTCAVGDGLGMGHMGCHRQWAAVRLSLSCPGPIHGDAIS